jgi:hypothetical protein
MYEGGRGDAILISWEPPLSSDLVKERDRARNDFREIIVVIGVDDLAAMEELADVADPNSGFALAVDNDLSSVRSRYGRRSSGCS